MLTDHNLSTIQLLNTATLPPLSQIAFKVAVTIATWEMRHRTRKSLTSLSEHQLKDIGMTRGVALKEARRWFWQS